VLTQAVNHGLVIGHSHQVALDVPEILAGSVEDGSHLVGRRLVAAVEVVDQLAVGGLALRLEPSNSSSCHSPSPVLKSNVDSPPKLALVRRRLPRRSPGNPVLELSPLLRQSFNSRAGSSGRHIRFTRGGPGRLVNHTAVVDQLRRALLHGRKNGS